MFQGKPKGLLLFSICFSVLYAFGGSNAENTSLSTRGWYLMEQGIILPAEEIYTDAYIASFNYQYPQPETDMDVYLYNSLNQMSSRGQEGILHIGIQGKRRAFADLPPLNLAFVIDISESMQDDDKINWIKESLIGFMNKIRAVDSLSLVSFNNISHVLFESTRMDSPQKRQEFITAVQGLSPEGGTDIETGLRTGYEQLLINYRNDSVNLALLFSDGTDFSARLAQAKALSGDIRVSLIWNNRNDLDLHVINPLGEEISFSNRKDSAGGMLDVDMNVSGETAKPVENIFWDQDAPKGKYRVYVQNFGYHELRYEPTNFQVEIKNGNERQHFEGRISGVGSNSDTEVCTFEFKGTEELALMYQMAVNNNKKSVFVSALGVGTGFDRELMQTLAQEGGGKFRGLSTQELMKELFESDQEFERVAVKTAQNLEIDLEFMSGIEILETWGYEHRIEKNHIYYQLPALHVGDYKTILVRYRLPPQSPGNKKQLATCRIKAQNNSGIPFSLQEKTLNIALSEDDPLEGIAVNKVLHSGTMLYFAETLKEIGKLYYAEGKDLRSLETALQKTREKNAELDQVKLRLDNKDLFTQEQNLLSQYDAILTRAILSQGGTVPEPLISVVKTEQRSRMSKNGQISWMISGPTINPAVLPNYDPLPNHASGFFGEISRALPQNEPTRAALVPFVSQNSEELPILTYLNSRTRARLAQNSQLTLLEQNYVTMILGSPNSRIVSIPSAVRMGKLLGVQYLITGYVIPTSTQYIVFSQVIHIETGEILSTPQIVLDRTQ
jgi:Ca-activated chloride channel family protein